MGEEKAWTVFPRDGGVGFLLSPDASEEEIEKMLKEFRAQADALRRQKAEAKQAEPDK